jgi:AcrR family transcriptional regulator
MPQPRLSRAEQRQQNRDRLLDAAERVFAERGYRVATVDDVAAAAGLTKGAVYSHFANKQELFAAAVERRYRRRADEFSAHMAAGKELTDGAAGAALDFAASIDDGGVDWALLFLEAWAEMLRTPEFGDALRAIDDRVRADLAEVVEARLAEQGVVLDLPPETVAQMVLVTTHGFGVQHRLDPEHTPAELFGELSGTLLLGLLARGRPPQ